jgi:arginase
MISMNEIKIGIAKQLYSGHYGRQELDEGPITMQEGGLYEIVEKKGGKIVKIEEAKLTLEEQKMYGLRYRLGLANNHLAEIVSNQIKAEILPIGLLANCNSLMGMLAGHQHASNSGKPFRVGLVWIDAHGDFNTPETSLSGMMGGMPVAISTGLCLEHIRRASGLDPPIPIKYVTMVGVRDTDPWEQYLIDKYDIPQISVEDIKRLSPAIDFELDRLSRITDLVYVHVDLDILDPDDIPGAGLPVENGPTAKELGGALEIMFEYSNVKGFGIASYPWRNDLERKGLKSVYQLIEGVISGVKNR